MFNAIQFNRKATGIKARDARHLVRSAGSRDTCGAEIDIHRTLASSTMPRGSIAPDIATVPFTMRRARAFSHGATGARLWTVTGITPERRQVSEESVRALHDHTCKGGDKA